MAKYEDVKERSTTGLAHVLEQRTTLVLDVCVEPTTIVVAESGRYAADRAVLVADLGRLTLTTVTGTEREKGMHGAPVESALMAKAYDRFALDVTSIQMLFARRGDDWRTARTLDTSPLHVLQPTAINLMLHKASVDQLDVDK